MAMALWRWRHACMGIAHLFRFANILRVVPLRSNLAFRTFRPLAVFVIVLFRPPGVYALPF